MKKRNRMLTTVAAALIAAVPVMAHEDHDHKAEGTSSQAGKEATATKGTDITVKGEVLDMVCYIDHNATGAKHADCAKKCINDGLPVGIKGEDGKTYLLVGEHKPLNSELAKYAAQTITVKGKAVSRDGFNMIENVEIQK